MATGQELAVKENVDDVVNLLRQGVTIDRERPITALGLSARAVLALDSIGVRTIGNLIEKTPRDVGAGHGCGPQVLAHIQQALAYHGLTLRDE